MNTKIWNQKLWQEFETKGSHEWAVYGDLLLERDDPRGLVIVLEQKLEGLSEYDSLREALEDKIEELYDTYSHKWLGEASDTIHASEHGFFTVSWRYGYLYRLFVVQYPDNNLEYMERVLDSPVSMYLVEFSHDAHRDPRPVFEVLASQKRPWRRCHLMSDNRNDPADKELCSRFSAAIPHVRELSLSGHGLFATFEHKSLRRLAMSGTSIADFGSVARFPRLRTLDFAVNSGIYQSHELSPGLCSAELLPELETLDLSRNIVGLGTDKDPVFHESSIFGSPLLRQLQELILPPLFNEEAVQCCITHVEQLREIPKLTVARVLAHYHDPQAALQPHFPSLQFGDEYPFRIPEEVSSKEVMDFFYHDRHKQVDSQSFRDICELVQSGFPLLSAKGLAAITELMQAYDEIYDAGDGEPTSCELPLGPILSAFLEIGLDRVEEGRLCNLYKDLLSHTSCCKTLTIEKDWGW